LMNSPRPSRPRMRPAHSGHRALDRRNHLPRRRRPVRPVRQPGQVVRQVPPDPNSAPSTDAPSLHGRLGHLRARQHRADRVQPLLGHQTTRPVPIPASRRSGRPRRRPHHGAEPGHCRASPGRRLSRIARRSTLPLPCHPWRRPLLCQGAELPVLIRELPLLPGHATPSGPGLPCADPCSPALCGDTVGSPVGSWSCGTEESRSPGPSLEGCACVGLTTVGTGRPAERLSVTDRGCL
jgi:hypothetical protein